MLYSRVYGELSMPAKKLNGLNTLLFSFLLLAVFSLSAFAENWPGYKGYLKDSFSSVTITPTSLGLKWAKRFNIIVPTSGWSNGTEHSRNLALYNSNLALVATIDPNVGTNTACVTVLNANTGSVLNCLQTNQRYGPYKSQMDTCDEEFSEHVLAWDPDTGYLFLAIGGDQADKTAIDPMQNSGSFDGTHIQAAVGAYQNLVNNWPGIRSVRTYLGAFTDNSGMTRAECFDPRTGGQGMGPDQWDYGVTADGSNSAGFYDVEPGSNYLIVNKNEGHDLAGGTMLINKYTGLAASHDWDQSYNTYLAWPAFKMWGGYLVNKDKAYYMGPYSPTQAGNLPGANDVNSGLRLGCIQYHDVNQYPLDGGYTGQGMSETATMTSKVFDYQLSSPAPCWVEWDSTYRNKAFLVDSSTGGVWAAWKPTVAGPVQLVSATPLSEQTYNLSVGANMHQEDIWHNMALADLGAAGKYIVYALFNAQSPTTRGVSNSNYPSGPALAPTGPSTLTVFDANAGTEKWTYQLNTAAGNGNYPTLPPNPCVLYAEKNRMIVTGNYAYVSWIDTQTGPNLKLNVVGFDITAASAPASPPTPFTYDLGVALNSSLTQGSGGNMASRATDMIAADGTLYVLVEEETYVSGDGGLTTRPGYVNAQQVIALSQVAQTPTFTSTPTATSTATATRTATQTPTPIASSTSTVTSSQTLTSSQTVTPSLTLTPSHTNTITTTSTQTLTSSQTVTPSLTLTSSQTFTITQTSTQSYTSTQTLTSTQTSTPSQTFTITQTSTQTNSPTQTLTPSETLTSSQTFTVTVTATQTATFTQTLTVTQTLTSSNTFTVTNTVTPSQTVTPSLTVTSSATLTSSLTFTPTPSGKLQILQHVPYPNPVQHNNMSIYVELADVPNKMNFKLYTCGMRLVRAFHIEQPGNNMQIVYDNNVARYAYTFNYDLTDGNGNLLANGLYYYVIESSKNQVNYRVIGKFFVLR